MQAQTKSSAFEDSKVKDLKNETVPECLYWSCEQVCDFIESLNLPQYKVISFILKPKWLFSRFFFGWTIFPSLNAIYLFNLVIMFFLNKFSKH
jgi:hypothetical protein